MVPGAHGTAVVSHATGGIAVVEVPGWLDLEGGVQLLLQLHDLVDGDDTRVVVDLSRVPICGATGLAALVTGHRRAVHRGGWLSLTAVQPLVAEALHATGLAGCCPQYPSVEAASTAVAAPSTDPAVPRQACRHHAEAPTS
ncbi:MAG: STAS domain-containing protein [Actinomycetes bacterium]